MPGWEQGLRLLPPWPSADRPFPARQGAGRELCRERVGVAGSVPKEQTAGGQKERHAHHVWRAGVPTCVRDLSDMLKLKSKQHESTLYYSQK